MRTALIVTCLGLLPLPAPAAPIAYQGPAFVAKRVVTTPHETETSTVWLSRHGMREESGAPGNRLIFIVDFRAAKAWVIDERRNTYQTMAQATAPVRHLAQARADTVFDDRPCKGFDLTRRLGPTRVAGRRSVRWVCGNSKTRREVMQWYDPALKLVIRERTPDGEQVTLRDFRFQTFSPSLFRLPPGVKPGRVGP